MRKCEAWRRGEREGGDVLCTYVPEVEEEGACSSSSSSSFSFSFSSSTSTSASTSLLVFVAVGCMAHHG